MDWSCIEERDEFLKHFLGLCQLFNVAADELTIKIYFRALRKYTLAEVVQGIDAAIRQCRFFPKPVELHELIGGSAEDVGEVEASKVLEAVKQVGAWKSVVFDDAVTAAVVEHGFGGWVKLCSSVSADEEMWFRKDFCRMYGSFSRRGVSYAGTLAGRAAIANEAHFNSHDERVALVGNVAQARALLAAGNAEKKTPIVTLAACVGDKLAVEAHNG